MSIARKRLEELNFTDITDTSRNCSYDFQGALNGEEIIVEVKGTTGYGLSVLFTANEIEVHRERHPRNMLVLVHSIDLARDCQPPVASGGIVEVHFPWKIVEEMLRPQTFSYVLRNLEAS
jgi:hypothetical protein